ncbi:MAG TPA: redox-sensing transcriptional repressor Rex [Bacillales bacterium]|nr:redox-sensing transcriptional repressor Rex [Bacillales bacterium]
MKKNEARIPQATAKRLPLYYRFLKNLHETGKQRVSSKELSHAVKVDSATIRRDFSYFGALGRKGYGYNVESLLEFFRKTLNQDELTKVTLIGVGNLGTALLRYNFMKNSGTQIVMAFDSDPATVGKEIGGVPVYDIKNFREKVAGEIPVAILTVPATAAQMVADEIVDSGIAGILNFTPARLSVPEQIRVHHIDLSVELESLLYFLKHYPLQ